MPVGVLTMSDLVRAVAWTAAAEEPAAQLCEPGNEPAFSTLVKFGLWMITAME